MARILLQKSDTGYAPATGSGRILKSAQKPILPQQKDEPKQNILQKVERAAVSPLVWAGTRIGQGISEIIKPGSSQKSTSVDLPILGGKYEVSPPTSIKKEIGEAAQVPALAMGPVSGGATMGFGQALKEDKGVAGTLGYTAGGALLGKALDVGANVAAKGIESAGKGIAKMFIPKSDAEAGILQAYKAATPFLDRVKAVLDIGGKKAPTTAASTAFEKGLVGTESMLGVQAKRAQNTLWNKLISPALEQSEQKIDMPTFLKEAEQKIINETPELTRKNVLLNALESVKDDYKETGQITLKELQKLKEGWADFVPEKAYKGQPIAGALNDVRNTLASHAREKIYNALGDNVKQAYFDYGNLHSITALGRKAMTGAIKGGTGTTLKNLLEQATIPIGTIAGQTIYKLGQGLEFIGNPGAKVLRNLLLGTGQDSGDKTKSALKQPANILPKAK